MRMIVAAVCGCLSIAGASLATEAQAAIRRPTNIPEQSLDAALQLLAKERGVQMIYPYSVVGDQHSGGARGDLTIAEALNQLLEKTGLHYRYLDEKTITISAAPAAGDEQSSRGSHQNKGAQKRDFWSTFRVAQLAEGQAALGPQAGSTADVNTGQRLAVEEIVVTALRRDQRLQDVPAALAVLSAEDVKAKGAQDMRDYLTTIPGVNYAENNVGGMRVTIRGISDGLVGSTAPLAAIYIDEAPVTENALGTFDPDIYDVDRIEVLKGPQGTLYGSGSMGGTVRIIGRKPELNVFEGAIEGTLSSVNDNAMGERVDGVINMPILQDHVALRMSAGYREDAGWIDDVTRNDDDANTVEKRNARAQVLFQPADRTSVTLGFLYQDEDRGLPPFDDLSLPKYQNGRIYRQGGDSDGQLFSLTLRQDWDAATLTAASNYLEKDSSATFDTINTRAVLARLAGVTVTPSDGIGLLALGGITQFTQEVRLASTGDSRLGWLVGGFYSDAKTDLTEAFDLSQAPSFSGVITGREFYESHDRFDTRQIAGFGELTFKFTDQLSMTAGARVFEVRQDFSNQSTGLLADGDSAFEQRVEQSSSTKKFLLQYQANPDHLVYAQAVQGFRIGGANGPVPTSTCGPDLEEAGYQSAPAGYGPDKLWNYEVGSKNALLDGRVQLNAAAFYVDWGDIQNTVGLLCGLTFVTNAGEAESKGIELETAFRPVDGLTLNLSTSYIDATLTSIAPGVAATEGDRLPLTAKWSGNLSALYERDLRGDLTGFVRSEVNYVGDRWNNFRSVGARAVLMDSYTTVSARLGVRTDRWSVALFGTNLTNEYFVLNVNFPSYELVGRPRTIGVNASVAF